MDSIWPFGGVPAEEGKRAAPSEMAQINKGNDLFSFAQFSSLEKGVRANLDIKEGRLARRLPRGNIQQHWPIRSRGGTRPSTALAYLCSRSKWNKDEDTEARGMIAKECQGKKPVSVFIIWLGKEERRRRRRKKQAGTNLASTK